MRKRFTLSAALFFALSATAPLAAQPPAPVTLVKASRLLDPRTGNVLWPAAVLIENGKIKEVGSPSQVQANAPAGITTIDLGSATLLPGLIDSHTHLLLDVIVPPEAESERRPNGIFVPGLLLAIVESPSKRVLLGAQLAREDLESGFTAVRNLGHSGVDGVPQGDIAINAGVAEIAHSSETTFQVFTRHLRAQQRAFSGRLYDRQQQARSEVAVEMARALGFWRHNYVEQQVSMTVNQSGQQGGTAKINGVDARRRVSLHPRREANLLDLAVFNQHGRGRKHVSRPWVEQPASFYQGDGSG